MTIFDSSTSSAPPGGQMAPGKEDTLTLVYQGVGRRIGVRHSGHESDVNHGVEQAAETPRDKARVGLEISGRKSEREIGRRGGGHTVFVVRC